MTTIPDSLQRLLTVQHNVVSLPQLDQGGLSRRRLRWLVSSGDWQRTHSGIYYASRGELPWLGRVWAASLRIGEGAVLAGTAAARMHRLVTDDPEDVTVYVPNRATPVPREGIVAVRSRTARKTQQVDGLACTTVAETIVDCAAAMSAHDLEALIGRAFQRRKCSASALRKALRGRRTVPQRTMLEAAAAAAADGAHSPLEMAYLHDVEAAHGLPTAARQVRLGSEREWVDMYYAGSATVVELDGRAFHQDTAFRDRQRDNRNAMRGIIPLRFGWGDVTGDPCGVARQVADALGLVDINPCPRCS